MHWIGFKTILWRECRVILEFWRTTLAPPVIATILYFTIFEALVGKRVNTPGGVDYLQYLAPGLEEITVSPLPGCIILWGYVIGGAIRGLLVGTVALAIAAIFINLHVYSILGSLAVVCIAAVVSALGGFVTALLVDSFEQVTTIQNLILMPLLYLGGIFAPLSMLPNWARELSYTNPMYYVVDAFRYGFLGIPAANFGVELFVMCVFGFVSFSIATKLMARGVGVRT